MPIHSGIQKVKPGAKLGDIGFVIQDFAEKNGFSIVREFCGLILMKKLLWPHSLNFKKENDDMAKRVSNCKC